MDKSNLFRILFAFSFFVFSISGTIFSESTYYDENGNRYINLNPDPDGEPWIPDGYTQPENVTYMSDDEIKSILEKQRGIQLPSKVDHSHELYSRTPFNQVGGSCGSASRICYQYAWEVNCYRKRDGSKQENMCPSHFTWMMTSQNGEKEVLAQWTGVPNAVDYGGETYSKIYGSSGQNGFSDSDYGWMQGYDKWYRALCNRITKAPFLSLKSAANLEILKGWMYNHNGDTSFAAGGIATFGCSSGGFKLSAIPAGQYLAGTQIVTSWSGGIDHGVTWAGYDDSVGYDFNGDGKIVNEGTDITKWERGALLFLNSWGASWGGNKNGTVWVPYRFVGGAGTTGNAELYYLRTNYVPKRVMKVVMEYSQRVNLQVNIGYSVDVNATQPSGTVQKCKHFDYSGRGAVPMLGKWADGKIHTEPMELATDATDITGTADVFKPIKYFLVINTKSGGTGKVVSMSVFDYIENPQGKETVSTQTNVSVTGGTQVIVSVVVPGSVSPIINHAHTPHTLPAFRFTLSPDKKMMLSFNASPAMAQTGSIELVNTQGRVMHRANDMHFIKGENSITLDYSAFAKGIYYCRIKMGKMQVIHKVIR